MTIYSNAHVRRIYERELARTPKDPEAAVEETASYLGIATKDVQKALAETAPAAKELA